MSRTELAEKIEKFLETYGKRAADEPEEWSSPDAAELEACAMLLRAGKKIPRHPWSEWGSGGYGPYTSKEGRAEHDEIHRLVEEYVMR